MHAEIAPRCLDTRITCGSAHENAKSRYGRGVRTVRCFLQKLALASRQNSCNRSPQKKMMFFHETLAPRNVVSAPSTLFAFKSSPQHPSSPDKKYTHMQGGGDTDDGRYNKKKRRTQQPAPRTRNSQNRSLTGRVTEVSPTLSARGANEKRSEAGSSRPRRIRQPSYSRLTLTGGGNPRGTVVRETKWHQSLISYY